MRLFIANPRGFCAGVERAVAIVDRVLDALGPPVFVRHEIVHNRSVVEALRRRGAVFVEAMEAIPPGAAAVVSAHGAAPAEHEAARRRSLRLFDATCPLVTKVHLEVARHARHGRSVVVIGHRGHVEVEGILGHFAAGGPGRIAVVADAEEAAALSVPDPARIGCVTQTTLAVDQAARVIAVLRRRFPALVEPVSEDICYATQNRQDAVRALARDCGMILVLGAPHSSNSVRLCEVAEAAGAEARLIERPEQIDPAWLVGRDAIGLTASASAPERLVQQAVRRIATLVPGVAVAEIGAPEQVSFRLPAPVRALATKAATDAGMDSSGGVGKVDETAPERTGLEEVVRAARDLARQARLTVEQAGGVAERELAMLLSVSEELRDRVATPEVLRRGREQPLFRRLRGDAHRAVDLGFDAAASGYVLAVETVENFLDRPRPPLDPAVAKPG